jgi:hypothetical protein
MHGVHSTAFVAFLWGDKAEQHLQAITSGLNLRDFTTARMILFMDDRALDSPYGALQTGCWEVRRFDVQILPASFRQMERLGPEVWSKLAVHKFLDGEFEVVAIIDLDMMALGNMDEIFNIPAPAGCFRGPRDAAPGGDVNRRPLSTWYYDGCVGNSHYLRGGINGGLWTCTPKLATWNAMLKEFETYVQPPNSSMAEQDFLSHFYAGNVEGREIWSNLHRSFNFQLHQVDLQLELVDEQNTWRIFLTASTFSQCFLLVNLSFVRSCATS